MIGRTLGHYRILEKIGAGGMGEVYRAHDERLDRDVALKVLPPASFADPTARARLLREARTASKLNHPHICTIHEVGEADGQAYIAMELVEGRPLSALVAGEALPTERAVRYGQQIADALAHAHERGIVHRDLKSANVVITPEGRAKILDFGLAKQLRNEQLEEVTRSQGSLTAEGAIMGTLMYMAPEQLRGQPAEVRSDVWALGVMLYEMLAGRRPFQGQTGFELSSAILRESPAPLPTKVPAEMRGVVERCLAKAAGERYQRAAEVRAVLEAIATGAVAPWAGLGYALRRRQVLAVSVAALLLVVVAVAANLDRVQELLGISSAKIESIAVLPLKNLSGDPNQDYFVEGTHEALITDLAKISTLRVIARSSVMRYKGTQTPLPEIAQQLNVDAVITGSVVREGDRVRVTAQLINARTEEHLWADRYERDLRDILSLQNEIVSTIARQVEVALTAEEATRLAAARPVNPEAYLAYSKGRYYQHKWTPEDFNRAIDHFQKAIDFDPTYAPAYAGLADTYVMKSLWGGETPQAAGPKAKAAAQKAIEFDDTLGEAHAALALVKFIFDWDWSGSEKHFQRALELSPGNPDALMYYNFYLSLMGRSEEAIAMSKRAIEVDPLTPTTTVQLGWTYIQARRYNDAIRHFEKMLETNPNELFVHLELAWSYAEKGMYEQALAECEKAEALLTDLDDQLSFAWLGPVYARAGRRDRTQEMLDRMMDMARQTYVDPVRPAILLAALGEKDRAIEWLRKGYQMKALEMIALKTDPLLDPLRDDPRFQDLLRQMNFPE